MEFHLLHTLVPASRKLSLYRVKNTIKITSTPWKLPHDKDDTTRIRSEHIFCVNIVKYGYDKILIGTDGTAYCVDLKTQEAKVVMEKSMVTFIVNYKNLTFFFFHSSNEVKILKDTADDGVFTSIAHLPAICTHWLSLDWAKFGGHVQQVKDIMYYLQQNARTLVRLDLKVIHRLIEDGITNCCSAMQPVNTIVNCFAASKLNKSQVYYVKGENEIWCNSRLLTTVQLADEKEQISFVACGRSNLVIPIYSTASNSTNFTLFTLKGKRLNSIYSKVTQSSSDPSHIDTTEIDNITFVVNCRIYHYFDLLAIVRNKLHIICDAVPSRALKDSEISTINHSLTVRQSSEAST